MILGANRLDLLDLPLQLFDLLGNCILFALDNQGQSTQGIQRLALQGRLVLSRPCSQRGFVFLSWRSLFDSIEDGSENSMGLVCFEGGR
jgi:hypothetical protein